MKLQKLLLVLVFPLAFSGCLEINEDITVSKTGAGNYAMKMDMGQLVEMMQSFMPKEEMEKAQLDRPRDTTIQLKDYMDSTTSLTSEEKNLLRDGSMHLNMNMDQKIFKVDMQYPFSSLANLQKLYVNLGKSAGGFGSMLGAMGGGAGGESPMQSPNLNKISSYYDLVTDKNSISRKLNKERFAAMKDDSMMSQLKGMSGMGAGMIDMKMNMIIHLPAAAKTVNGSKATLSADKKTVTVQNNMLDVFEHPEYFEFSVQY
jgi:hypothetical protein